MRKFHLELYPMNEQVKPYEIPFGHLFQSVIFGWLHEKCPKLTHELHSYGKIRPYAINCHIHRKDPLVEFTINSFDDSLSTVLHDTIYSVRDDTLDVAGKKYQLQRLHMEKIHLDNLIKASAPINHFHVRFITPIHFRTPSGNYPIRFPMPSHFFSNILKIWNTISPETTTIDTYDLIRWADVHCYPSGYKMKSGKYFISSNQTVAGGLGFVSYRIQKPNYHFYDDYNEFTTESKDKSLDIDSHYRNSCQWIDLLCRVAEYTNLGGNRTAGMGVIKYYPKRYLEKSQSANMMSHIG